MGRAECQECKLLFRHKNIKRLWMMGSTFRNRTRDCFIPMLKIMMIVTFLGGVECRGPRKYNNNNSNRNNGIFIQIPYSSPPTVRPPPYANSKEICPEMNVKENWIGNLCGDLNSGFIPINPLGHQFKDGTPYPFEIIKNKTLDFFRHALPVLKTNKSLPKVARYSGSTQSREAYGHGPYRAKRDTSAASTSTSDESRGIMKGILPRLSRRVMRSKERPSHYSGNTSGGGGGGFGRFCDPSSTSTLSSYYTRLCKLYNAMWGKSPYSYQRQDSVEMKPNQVLTVSTQTQHQLQQLGIGPTLAASPGGQKLLAQLSTPKVNPKSTVASHYVKPSYHPPPQQVQELPKAGPFSTGQESQVQTIKTGSSTIKIQPLNMNGGGPVVAFPGPVHGQSKKGKNHNFQENPNIPSKMPPTPCPSSAEYLTPVFARNHEGAWRYVVQIPMEGYFTQTVEVTKCLEQKCYYMDGGCRSSPRWQSLLVAEMFYPNTVFPTTPKPMPSPLVATTSSASLAALPNNSPPPVSDFNQYQQYLYKRAAAADNVISPRNNPDYNEVGGGQGQTPLEVTSSFDETPSNFDGCDEIGCFQIRLFYDWFLIPGSCKCWKFDFRF